MHRGSRLPTLRARLAERVVFNFRMPPEALRRRLPATWLEPETIDGSALASFCVLDLRRVGPEPLTFAGLDTISSASRFAVRDHGPGGGDAAVFVEERRTSSVLGAWFTTLGFSAPHPFAATSIARTGSGTRLRVAEPSGAAAFDATFEPAARSTSTLFRDADAFASFFAQGIVSYGLSRYPDRLTVVDLHKDDTNYLPLTVRSIGGGPIDAWIADGAVFDSAFRTEGGAYRWTSRGLVPIDLRGGRTSTRRP